MTDLTNELAFNIMPLSLGEIGAIASEFRYRLGPAIDLLYVPGLSENEAIARLSRYLTANADILRTMVSSAAIATSDESIAELDYVGLVKISVAVIEATQGAHLPGEIQAALISVLTPFSQLLSGTRH
jgi:hypothetical protein